jgi:hypothetical protein
MIYFTPACPLRQVHLGKVKDKCEIMVRRIVAYIIIGEKARAVAGQSPQTQPPNAVRARTDMSARRHCGEARFNRKLFGLFAGGPHGFYHPIYPAPDGI